MQDKSSKRSSKKEKKKKKSGLKILKIILLTLLSLFLISGVVLGAITYGMIKTAPPLDVDKVLSLNSPAIFFDDKGNIVDEYKTEERRIPVSINEIPEDLKNAFLAIEDIRFKDHNGLDYKRLAGAIFYDVKKVITKSKGSFQGASTITQQLIKQKYFLKDSLENRANIERKVQEMYLAVKLDKILSKDQILESYLNTIQLGGNAYGVESAANRYFKKSIDELNLKECAFLAGAANNPGLSHIKAYEAFKKNEPFKSKRTKIVLGEMLRYNFITQKEYDEAVTKENDGTVKTYLDFSFSKENLNKMAYEWFSRPVVEQIKKDLAEKYGNKYSEKEINENLASDGWKIYTTMDTELQNTVQKIMDDDTDPAKKKTTDYLYPRKKDLTPVQPNLQASAVIMDYHSGEVKVIIGGRGEQPPMSYNRAASDKFLRSPGSCIKPLTVYAPAIDSKIFTAATVIEDSPVPKEIGEKYAAPGAKPYDPRNCPSECQGYVTLREGLLRSINKVAVKIEDKIGLKTGVEYGRKFGIDIDETDEISMAAVALGQIDGGSSRGTNPLTLSAAFGTFGNNGMLSKPRLYTKVLDKNNNVILETKYEAKQVISPESAYIMYDLLEGPISGKKGSTAPSARIKGMSIRGKTGTASDKKNLWFTGLTPYYSASVWVGNDNYSKIEGKIGWRNFNSNCVAKIWSEIMTVTHEGLEDKQIEKPAGIVDSHVCKDSGNLPKELSYKDPRGSRVYNELFIEGTRPHTFDEVHVKAKVVKKIDDKGNERYVLATDFSNPDQVEERVFITRNYVPKVKLKDQIYVLPIEYDDALPEIKEEDNGLIEDFFDYLFNSDNNKQDFNEKNIDKKNNSVMNTKNDANNDSSQNSSNNN